MDHDLDAHLAEAGAAIAAAVDLEAVSALDADLLGKRSVVSAAKKSLGGLEAEERREAGQRLNEVRAELEHLLEDRRIELKSDELAHRVESERLDLTELDQGRRLGHRHVITQTWERLEDLFIGMGYTVAEGPEIEDEWHLQPAKQVFPFFGCVFNDGYSPSDVSDLQSRQESEDTIIDGFSYDTTV